MALDVATLPLILYNIVRYITIEYYIARTSYTFLPCFITLPFLLHFFHFQCFFYLYIIAGLEQAHGVCDLQISSLKDVFPVVVRCCHSWRYQITSSGNQAGSGC